MLAPDVTSSIATDLGLEGQPVDLTPLSGSSLNRCWKLQFDAGAFFLKTNQASRADMLSAEAEGLAEILNCGEIAVPSVAAQGLCGDTAYLVLEWLKFGASNDRSNAQLGRALAHMHAHTASRFGWHRDNTIGLTPQLNRPADSWWAFFRDRRLLAQRQFLTERGIDKADLNLLDAVVKSCEVLFAGDDPEPSLLHGDLWGGNWATLADGRPCLFDPAVYFGDAETDLAMTRLFGGFAPSFYSAYRELRPDSAEGPARRELYRLYHLLNHWNLFGRTYASQCRRSMKTVLKMT